jgi:hypothetical protein
MHAALCPSPSERKWLELSGAVRPVNNRLAAPTDYLTIYTPLSLFFGLHLHALNMRREGEEDDGRRRWEKNE